MDELFDRLFPICRSITGPGLRETLSILSEYLPLEQLGEPTGSSVFDWTIPKEWRIREAWVKGPDGSTIIDFKKSNLHVLNYSIPVNRKMGLDELKEHLYSLPHMPEAIPYVTSYYKERWGFCLPHRQLEQLEPGTYHAYIDSELADGELNFGHAILPGESNKEILISTYVCHPSLANNELSGPVTAAFLYRRLAAWTKRRFTYRFVFVPETIGSITYLHRFGKHLKEKLHTGLVLTCLGGAQHRLSYKMSRRGNVPTDRLVQHLFRLQALQGDIRGFTPINGSDERQYCSPGFNLPVGQMSRMVYNCYPGYHNSFDTKETMTIEALQQSVDELEQLLRAIELDGYYVNQNPYGEVKLDKHDLYPDLNSPLNGVYSSNNVADNRVQLDRILVMLNYCDGEHSLLDIADKCGCSILQLEPIVRILKEKQLLQGPYLEPRNEMIE
ncbi:DUF4910 domain-containing protein [Paenibacillus hamazuiensis]|uniref:DUF4910 domain-containing protein n=1 Tax=Paenibacillus hamazuiensis TaxID=2936508 RepID=UPI00200CAF78|nr:DUF4910 domain-containing protein [Paenibacillus hamazuiensis]